MHTKQNKTTAVTSVGFTIKNLKPRQTSKQHNITNKSERINGTDHVADQGDGFLLTQVWHAVDSIQTRSTTANIMRAESHETQKTFTIPALVP